MWFVAALFSALFFSIANITDKFIVNKNSNTPFLVATISAIFDIVAAFLLFSIFGFEVQSSQVIYWALFAGLLNQLGAYSYYFALSKDEVSRVVPFFYFGPAMVAVATYFIFKEVLELRAYVGIILLVIGSVLLSYLPGRKRKNRLALIAILFSTVFYSSAIIIQDYIILGANIWQITGWLFLGMAISAIPSIFLYGRRIITGYNRQILPIFIWTGIGELVSMIGYAALMYALNVGLVAIVNSILTLQALFVLLFSLMLDYKDKKILDDYSSFRITTVKFIAICVMMTGVIIIGRAI